MNEIGLLKSMMKKRRDILLEMRNIKNEIDSLLHKGFFKELLQFYKDMEDLDGFAHLLDLYGRQELEDCDSCLEGKMKLVETLIFRMNESLLSEKIERLNKLHEEYKELKDVAEYF